MRPMLATRGVDVPAGARWAHEVKWDGVRVLAHCGEHPRARLTSRNDNDVSPAWPELTTPPLPGRDLLVDGEVIALNDAGLPDFRTLQERIHQRRPAAVARLAEQVPATLMVFDLLRVDGEDLSGQPWEQRRARLEAISGPEGIGATGWQVPPTYDDGAMLLEATRRQGLEGVVSKRRDARYTFGARSPHWLKFAHRHHASYVVGGWRPQEGASADRLGALLVGEPGPDGLAYRGRVGSGIGPRQARTLGELLAPLARGSSPFGDEVPRADARGTRWVEPVVVVDLATHGHGHQRLRQPSFHGVRTDLAPGDLPGPDGVGP